LSGDLLAVVVKRPVFPAQETSTMMTTSPVRRITARFAVLVLILPLLILLLSSPERVAGHDEPDEKEVTLSCSVAEVVGTLTLPNPEPTKEKSASSEPARPRPCVVIVGGTMSHTRDGEMVRRGVPKREALARLAHALAEKGYASLRYDKVGYGKSKAKPQWTGAYQDEATVAVAAISHVRSRKEFGPVVLIGESGGAYLACLAAKEGTAADAYIFLGAHCGPAEAIYEYNFAPLVKYAESSSERRSWVEKELRFELALGKNYKAMFDAANTGDKQFEVVDGDYRKTVDLRRRQEELKMPPDEMFQHIQAPALAISGDKDMNVPPSHAALAVSVMRKAGNHATTCLVLRGVDHSFQKVPDDEELRFRERYNFQSFRRDYDPKLNQEVVAWLDQTLAKKPTAGSGAKRKEIPEPFAKRGVDRIEKDPKTDNRPARTYLAPGIQIVEDITDKKQTADVGTLEGRIGPLLLGQDSQAHFIDMPAGMYCEEHPHSAESIIYTVRGKWVLCSGGRRQVMKPGSLFHFAANTPTGYEVPFDEDAYILIFKGRRITEKEQDFINYLKGFSERLKREQQAGIPYLLKDLPKDHPAIRFSKEVNPSFDPYKAK
jgi:pimeloyl-ACP methyl ester carboxylesterase/quercetin dioxygenase-like cupin family protein